MRWQELLRIGIRLSVAGLALVLVMRLPLVALGNSGTDEEVALFSAAQRFGDAAWLLATTAGVALLPGWPSSRGPTARGPAGSCGGCCWPPAATAAALAVAAQPLAEPVMRLVFGSDFAGGDEVLRIILAGLPAYVALGVSWYAIVAFDGEPQLLKVGLAGLAVCVAATALLVSGGADGAGWAYVVSFYAMAGLSLAALARQLRTAESGDIRLPGYESV